MSTSLGPYTVTFSNNSFNIEWASVAPAVSYPAWIDIFLVKDDIHVKLGETTLDYRLCANPVTGSGKAFYDALVAMKPSGGWGGNVVVTNLLNPMPVAVTTNPVNATISGSVNVGNFPAVQDVNVTNWPTVLGTVDITEVGGNAVASTGTSGVLAVGGSVAHDAVNTTNPVVVGGQVIGGVGNVGTLANGDVSFLAMTTNAQLITKEYCTGDDQWQSFGNPAASTFTIRAAPAAGLRLYMCSLQITCTSSTGNGVFTVSDTGGNMAQFAYANSAYHIINFEPPLRTSGTALAISGTTSNGTLYWSAQGFTGL